MKSLRVLGVVSIVLAAITGCYGARGDGNDDGDGYSGFVREEDFIDSFPEQLCNKLAGCCGKIGYDIDPVTCTSELRIDLAQLGAPNSTYDGNAAAACQSNYLGALAQCKLPTDAQIEPCIDIYHGSVPIGGSCEDDAECIEGAYCYYDATSYLGTCQSLQGQLGGVHGAPGEACSGTCFEEEGDVLCDGSSGTGGASCYSSDNLYCDYLTYTCMPVPGLGESCSSSYYCQDNLYCDYLTYTCAPPPGPGESCSSSYYCQDGLYCDDFLTCSPLLADGAPCYDSSQCTNVCGSAGICVTADAVSADVCIEF